MPFHIIIQLAAKYQVNQNVLMCQLTSSFEDCISRAKFDCPASASTLPAIPIHQPTSAQTTDHVQKLEYTGHAHKDFLAI